MLVQGKVIAVTGAGSGIGQELTVELLRRGARVAAIDVNSENLEQTKTVAAKWSGALQTLVTDVTNNSAVRDLPAAVLQHFGQVDGIINNAGIIQPFVKLLDLDDSTIHRILDVNFFGTLHMLRAFLPLLQARPEAHIVNVASMGGVVPVPGQTVYGASKAAVKLMTEGLSGELLHTGVRVSVAIPGGVTTNIMANSGVAAPTLSETGAKKAANMPALSATDAAVRLIDGMERNAFHIVIGKDAWMAEKLYRFSPRLATLSIARKMRVLLSSS